MQLLQPKKIEIEDSSGEKRSYIISKFPAIVGREIISQYPTSGMPKIGEYALNEKLMKKLMRYVAVSVESGDLILESDAMINNHVPDWETLVRIEWLMMEYNCSFFVNGKASSFLEGIITNSKELITSTLTDLLAQSSQTEKQPSKSSKKNTP